MYRFSVICMDRQTNRPEGVGKLNCVGWGDWKGLLIFLKVERCGIFSEVIDLSSKPGHVRSTYLLLDLGLSGKLCLYLVGKLSSGNGSNSTHIPIKDTCVLFFCCCCCFKENYVVYRLNCLKRGSLLACKYHTVIFLRYIIFILMFLLN